MRTLLSLAALGALLGCGGAHEGGACSGDGYKCDGASAILECRSGTWVSLPCAGPNGCSASISGITCDITGNQAGDGCPAPMEGTGFCRGNPPSLFACRNLQLAKVQDCSACVVGTGSITCSP